MALTITFPKQVEVANTRLVLLYYFFALISTGYVVYSFVEGEAYLSTKVPSGNVQFWPLNWNIDESTAKSINDDEAQNEYCRTPEKFEYCDDEMCSFSSKNMKCMDICTSESKEECLENSERWIKEDSGIFFPTFIAERSIVRIREPTDAPGTFSERQITSSMRVVKGIEEMGIAFDHEYAVRKSGKMQYGGSKSVKTEYGKGVLTILKDNNGIEIKRWEPGRPIELTLQTLFEADMIDLTFIDPEYGKNYVKGAQIPEGLLTRLGGVEITIEVGYHNPTQHNEAWKGPVAYLHIHHNTAWTSKPQLQVTDGIGSQRLRYFQGVRIRFQSSGSFGWVSPDRIVNGFTSAMVLAGAAKNLIFIFAMYCLGVVSRVYRGFVYQECQVSHEIHGLASRLCCCAAAFVQLKDAASGISETQLLHTFTGIFSGRTDLSSSEIKKAVSFIFRGMNSGDGDGKDGSQEPSIGIQEFSKACTSSESLDFETMTALFDADRKHSCLTRTFAGPSIRKLMREEKAHQEKKKLDRSMSLAPPDGTQMTALEVNLKKLESNHEQLKVHVESHAKILLNKPPPSPSPSESGPTIQSIADKVQTCEQKDADLNIICNNLQQQIVDLQNALKTSSSAHQSLDSPQDPPASASLMGVVGQRLNTKAGCASVCSAPVNDPKSEMVAIQGSDTVSVDPSKAILAPVQPGSINGRPKSQDK